MLNLVAKSTREKGEKNYKLLWSVQYICESDNHTFVPEHIHKLRKKQSHGDRDRDWRSTRWHQALSGLTSDCHLLWCNNSFLWAMLTTCVCEQQGKLTQALLCLPGGKLTKGEEHSGRRENRSHTCYFVTDRCHMSLPALRGNGGWGSATNRGQQRASDMIHPSKAESWSSGSNSQRIQTVWICMSSHKCPPNPPMK